MNDNIHYFELLGSWFYIVEISCLLRIVNFVEVFLTWYVNFMWDKQKYNNLRLAKLLYAFAFDCNLSQWYTMHNLLHSLITAYAYTSKLQKDAVPLMSHTPQVMQAYYDHALDSNAEAAAYTIM